jgi:hypothetical protein
MIKILKFDQKIVIFEKNQAFEVGRELAFLQKYQKMHKKQKIP